MTSGRLIYFIVFLICGSLSLLHSGAGFDKSSTVVPSIYGAIYPEGLQLPSCYTMRFFLLTLKYIILLDIDGEI